MKKIIIVLICVLLFIPNLVLGAEYHCIAKHAFNSSGLLWSKEKLKKFTPGVMIKHYPKASNLISTISRCSYSQINNRQTCDTYTIEHYVTYLLPNNSMFIDKFYVFSSQLDVQLYISSNKDIQYIENNGRGNFYEGECTVK